MNKDTVYWIWLQQVLGYASPCVGQILSAKMDAKTFYNSRPEQLLEQGVITKKQLERLKTIDIAAAHAVMEICEKIGCAVITPSDENFPKKLRQIYGVPAVLYALGDVGCLMDKLAIAMVGTRNPSPYGQKVADMLSCGLAEVGAVVISGMALGIDTHAHTGALKGEGKTVAVLGCGLPRVYPAKNAALMELIARHGAVISEFTPNTPPDKSNFPIRNRIISGLSDGVVVVEGEKKSGSLITAGHALSQDRDVFAVPGSIFDPRSHGPHWLMGQGAKPVGDVNDILEEYKHCYPDTIITKSAKATSTLTQTQIAIQTEPAQTPPQPKSPPKKPAPPSYLNPLQRSLYDILQREPQTADTLTVKTSCEVKDVLAAMTQLEIYGVAELLPSRGYVWRQP